MKKDAKVVAKQLGISEQEAEGRIVAELGPADIERIP